MVIFDTLTSTTLTEETPVPVDVQCTHVRRAAEYMRVCCPNALVCLLCFGFLVLVYEKVRSTASTRLNNSINKRSLLERLRFKRSRTYHK